MAIKNYTSGVASYTSLAEIQDALARAGATKIMVDYESGKPIAVTFAIETVNGTRGFRLPVAVDGTLRVFAAQRIKADRAQAARERREARLREMLNTNYGNEPTAVVRYGK